MSVPAVPPGPKGSLIGGNLAEFRKDRLGTLHKWSRQYGDIFRVRLGPRQVVVVNHPDLIEDILVTQHRQFQKHFGIRAMRPVLGNGLLTSEGDFWLRQRRLAQPAFHRQRIASYAHTMVSYTERMLERWQHSEVRDIHDEMMQLTLEVVAKTLFDADVAASATEVGEAMELVLEGFVERVGTTFPLPDWLPTPSNLRLRKAIEQLENTVYGIIRGRRQSGQDSGDLLSMLMHARDEDGSRMSDRQLRDEVMTLFLAGHETTAIALSWTWYLLSANPDAEAKLHAELDEVLGGQAPALADLPRLPYTEAVLTESMRLYPPAWGIGREPVSDCEVGGYRIPAGTTIIMSPFVMHRDPRFFEEPEHFRPERWSGGLAKRLPKFAYFPFGGGPRLCIGNAFATMESTLMLAAVARRFRLELLPGQNIRPWPAVTIRPVPGVRMRLMTRGPAHTPVAEVKAQ